MYSPLLPVQQPQISELPVYDNNDKIIIYIKLITAAQYFNPLRDSTGISEKKNQTQHNWPVLNKFSELT